MRWEARESVVSLANRPVGSPALPRFTPPRPVPPPCADPLDLPVVRPGFEVDDYKYFRS